MAYWVVTMQRTPENIGPGGITRVARKLAGPYTEKANADQQREGYERDKKETMDNRDLPSEARKMAWQTDYAVWSDETIEAARRAGVQI